MVPRVEKQRLVLGQRQPHLSWMPQLAVGEQLPVFKFSHLPGCLFDSSAAGNNAPAVTVQVVFVSAFLPAEKFTP